MAISDQQFGARVRVLPRFPARVEAGVGLNVERANGTYTFSLDYGSLTLTTVVPDPDNTYLAVWDEPNNFYYSITVSSFSSALSTAFAAGLTGVSTTNLPISTGSKTFSASTNRVWMLGQRLRAASDDGAILMEGEVTTYVAATGELTLDVDYTEGGPGNHADWNISVAGARGEQGSTGASGPGTGDVIGPASSIDGHFAIFDSTTGKLLKDSLAAPGALATLSSVNTSQISSNAVLYEKMQDITTTSRVLGRKDAAPGDPQELTLSEILDFVGSAAQGDILYRGASSWARLGAGTSGQFLKTQGVAANPVWATPTVGARIVGEIVAYAGTSAPSLWLLCSGALVSRTTYSDLFIAISTTYSAGDGSTTFGLPDLRGRVIAGKDNMGGTSANRLTALSGGVDGDTLAAVGGLETHTLTEPQLPAHDHPIDNAATTVVIESGGDVSVASTAAGTTGDAGDGNAHNNVQPTIILNYIIYAGV